MYPFPSLCKRKKGKDMTLEEIESKIKELEELKVEAQKKESEKKNAEKQKRVAEIKEAYQKIVEAEINYETLVTAFEKDFCEYVPLSDLFYSLF